MQNSTIRNRTWSDWLLAYYKFSRRINVPEIISFGLIFYGLSVFFNRPTSVAGLFASIEKVTNIDGAAWAIVIVLSIVLITMRLSLAVEIISTLALIIVMCVMWWGVTIANLPWQGVVTFSICVIACVKTSIDTMLAQILIKQGKL